MRSALQDVAISVDSGAIEIRVIVTRQDVLHTLCIVGAVIEAIHPLQLGATAIGLSLAVVPWLLSVVSRVRAKHCSPTPDRLRQARPIFHCGSRRSFRSGVPATAQLNKGMSRVSVNHPNRLAQVSPVLGRVRLR